jgi:hypothetical protein
VPDPRPARRHQRPGSQQVDWWAVHEHVVAVLGRVGTWPAAGTPAWCDLPGDDIRKTAALFDAAQHWALRVETCQAHLADASQAISAAADWHAVAAHLDRRRPDTYIPRKTA